MYIDLTWTVKWYLKLIATVNDQANSLVNLD